MTTKIQIKPDTEFILASTYLHSGKGLKQANLEILGAIAALQQKHQRHVVAAGDWQNKPMAIKSTDLLYRGKLSIKAPDRATCIMKKSSSIIDYFMVSNNMVGRMGQVQVCPSSYIATHRPVSMSMACSASHVENKVRMPTKIPAQPISNNGPINKPADWTAAEEALDRAIIAAHRAVKQEWASTRTLGKIKRPTMKAQKASHPTSRSGSQPTICLK